MRFIAQRIKRPGEHYPIGVSFASDTAAVVGDTSTDTYTVAAYRIEADNLVDVTGDFLGEHSRVGEVVSVELEEGTPEADYLVVVNMTTTQGYKYEHEVVQRVRAHG
jgi:hypothetical protein